MRCVHYIEVFCTLMRVAFTFAVGSSGDRLCCKASCMCPAMMRTDAPVKHDEFQKHVPLRCAGNGGGMELTLALAWRSFCRPVQGKNHRLSSILELFSYMKDTVSSVLNPLLLPSYTKTTAPFPCVKVPQKAAAEYQDSWWAFITPGMRISRSLF